MKKLSIFIIFFCVVLFRPDMARTEVGVTDNEIRIGSTMDLSGPIAFMGTYARDGALLYFRYVNDNGGVYGRKIKFLVEDDGYQAPRSVLGAKKLIERDKVFCMMLNLGAVAIEAMYPLLVQHNVPMFMSSTHDSLVFPPRKLLFLKDTSYTIQGSASVKYMVDILKTKNPKIAVIYQDDSPGQLLRDGIKKKCKEYNLNVLELPFKKGSIDFSSHLSKCKENNITHIFTFVIAREPAMIFREAERIQYKAVYFLPHAATYPKVLELAGKSLDFTNGVYGATILGDVNSDAWKFFKNLLNKYNVNVVDETMLAAGYAVAVIMVEIIKRAGKDLTRENLIKAAETLHDFDFGMTVPVTWTPERRDGGRSVKILKAVNGQWITQTGWIGVD